MPATMAPKCVHRVKSRKCPASNTLFPSRTCMHRNDATDQARARVTRIKKRTFHFQSCVLKIEHNLHIDVGHSLYIFLFYNIDTGDIPVISGLCMPWLIIIVMHVTVFRRYNNTESQLIHAGLSQAIYRGLH